MTVQELITRLAKEDPDSVVLAGDNDGWYYDVEDVAVVCVLEGREVKPPPLPRGSAEALPTPASGEFCVVVRP